jgi:hypothetical protein|tara:strand:+ start:9059 stop:9223 length:165 start_codon:yes stop_codon:yes gene_type:complete
MTLAAEAEGKKGLVFGFRSREISTQAFSQKATTFLVVAFRRVLARGAQYSVHGG